MLDPIPTTGLTTADVEELTRTTRDLMFKEMVKLTEKARGQPVVLPAEHTNGVAKVTGSDMRVAA